MIRQVRAATLFMTLSASETRWFRLLSILSAVVDGRELNMEQCQQLTWSVKCRLITSDRVTFARHFDYAVHCFIRDLFFKELAQSTRTAQ